MKRRRFLQIAVAAALARPAQAATWQGYAFGADLTITLPRDLAPQVLGQLRAEIAAIEATFSLYDPASELCRLNARGHGVPSRRMAQVLALADQIHAQTGGRFDPTVQSLWEGREGMVGWDRVRRTAGNVRLGAGQSLTLNGIVQGYAADQVSALLAAAGYADVLVDMGEFKALGRDAHLGIVDPVAGYLGARHLPAGRALATSSPKATLSPSGQPHIFGPHGEALRWSTVVIEADQAAVADAVSTAACVMERPQIEALARALGLRGVLVDLTGDLQGIGV